MNKIFMFLSFFVFFIFSNLYASQGENVIIKTNVGDIRINLFQEEAPKTVENFKLLAERNYYNDVIFHRVIRNFMIQGGDPTGTGRGGESAWGGRFEDEFASNLLFDRPGLLAMANAGPNTNGSQFFITTVPTPHLNNRHTIFGEVVEGMDIVRKIESAKTGPRDKPIEDIKIVAIEFVG